MKNKILHLVTNRDADFQSTLFPSAGEFEPVTLSPDSERVRRLLQLHRVDTDYYVVGVLNTVDAFPFIRDSFQEIFRTYDLTQITRPPVQLNGCELLPNPKGPPHVRPPANSFPVTTTTELSYVRPGVLGITYGQGSVEIPVSDDIDTLRLEWPASSGISGDLKCLPSFSPGWSGFLTSWPVGYPYDIVVDTLMRSGSTAVVLRRSGLTEQFYRAQSNAEKVAVMALGLAMTHPLYER